MNTSKIIKGVASGRGYSVTSPIIKEDYGLYLKIEGVELPSTYQVDFSNDEHHGTSVTMIGNADGVLIPHQFIDSGKDVFAFLYHVGDNYGRTVFKFRIPNKLRPDRTDEEPTPEQQSVIDQTISALNEAVAQTAQDKADADVSAQNASADAERAEEAKTDAQNYAIQAEQSATDAHESATASAQSAQSAEQSAQTASAKADSITGLKAQATTLPEGSSATASYSDGTLTLGIPKGDRGEQGMQGIQGIQGERGLTGASGVYIGDTEPTDKGINVWIDTSEDDDDKSSPIVGIGRVGYMVVASDTSADKSSPIVGVGQAGYMKVKG